MAGGLQVVPDLDLGIMSCGSVVQEIGVLANTRALSGLFDMSKMGADNFTYFLSAIKNTASIKDVMTAQKKFLDTPTAFPICTKYGSYAHFMLKNQIDLDN